MNSIWLNKNPPKTLSTDYLIIGGGISGLGMAHWLSKEKGECIVLEKNTLASGATGRNAGFLSTGSLGLFNSMVNKYGLEQSLRMRQFYKTNHELLVKEIIQKNKKLDYQKSGSLSLLFDKNEENYCGLVSALNDNGFNFKYLSAQDVDNLGITGSLGGFLDLDDGQIHSYKLIKHLEKILLKTGRTKIFENEETIEIQDNQVRTNQYIIKFKKLIYATNAYTPLLLPQIKEYIKPIRGQMLALEPGEKFIPHNIYASKMLCYFRQLPQGELIIGGFRTLNKKDEVGYDNSTSDIIQNAFEGFIKTHMPKLANRKVTHRWGGTMAFTFDENPLVGEIKPNHFLLGGYQGHGMGKAFACAEALANLILKGTPVPDFIDIKRIDK